MPILVRDLVFGYGDAPLLNGVSLTVEDGECVMVTGGSGTGKTTLMRLIAGLLTPAGGSVERPDRLAAVFQEDRLFRGISALKNAALVGRAENAEALFREAGMTEYASLPAEKLSGGTRRRVAILRALNSPADALLLDEPFTGLDDANRRKMAAMIRRVYAGKPILLISHDPSDGLLLGARTVVLSSEGKISG